MPIHRSIAKPIHRPVQRALDQILGLGQAGSSAPFVNQFQPGDWSVASATSATGINIFVDEFPSSSSSLTHIEYQVDSESVGSYELEEPATFPITVGSRIPYNTYTVKIRGCINEIKGEWSATKDVSTVFTGPLTPLLWANIADLSKMWSDTGGTVPAVVDGAVARLDMSGSLTAIATQGTNSPILRTSSGRRYLQTINGTSNGLVLSSLDLSAYGTISTVTCLRKATDPATGTRAWNHRGTSNPYFELRAPTGSAATYQPDGSNGSFRSISHAVAAPNTSVISTVYRSQDTPSVASRINGGSWVGSAGSMGTGNFGSGAFGLCSTNTGTGFVLDGWMIQFFMFAGALSDTNFATYETFCAACAAGGLT